MASNDFLGSREYTVAGNQDFVTLRLNALRFKTSDFSSQRLRCVEEETGNPAIFTTSHFTEICKF